MANAYIIGQGTGTGAAAPGANASVGLNGAPAPTSSTEIGFIGPGGLEVGVSASNPLPITGTILANNLSVGATGVAAPAFATEIGIIDAAGHLVGSSASNPVRIDPTGTTIQPVSGTITALQGTSPWVVSNAGTFAVQATISGNVTVVQPTGTNLHVFVDNATATAGTLSNNTAAPIADNVGVLPAVANAANPTLTEGFQTLLSQDLSGNLRVKVNAPLPAGTNVIGHVITDTGSTTTVTGTVAVTQSTSPWVVSGTVTITPSGLQNVNVTQWNTVALGSPSAYGTSPGAVNVIGVNAFITNTPAVTLASTTITGNVTVVQPTGTNLHVVVDAGSALTASVTGTKSNNAVVPGATNLGVLPGIANAATQTWTEGDQVLESMDLSGRQRIRGTLTNNNAAPAADGQMALSALANAVAPTYTEGDLVLESVDLNGNHRVIGTKTNNAAAPTTQLGVMPALANAAAPTLTEGFQNLLSEDLSGRLRVLTTPAAGAITTVVGNLTNNNAAPAATEIGVLPALANAANPTWTEGDQVLLSEDLSGHLRVVATGPAAAGAAVAGNPILVAGKNESGNTQDTVILSSGALLIAPSFAGIDGQSNTEVALQDQTAASRHLVVDTSVFNGTTWDRTRSAGIGQNVAATTGIAASMSYGAVTTAAPTYTTGTSSTLSLDTAGNLRVTPTAIGTLTNNNAAPGSVNVGVLPALANAANPSWTEGDQVLLSVDLSGRNRITGQAATGAALGGNPVVIGGANGANVAAANILNGALVVAIQQVPVDAQTNQCSSLETFSGTGNPTQIFPFTYNGTTWDRTRSATIGNAVAATGIQATAAYGEYLSTAPAPTTGQYSALQTDYAGSLFVKPIRRSTTAASKATITNSAVAVTIMPAQAAGIFADISNMVVTVTSAATISLPFTVTLSDGTATYIYDMVTGALATSAADPSVLILNFNPPLPATTAATAWTIATNVATVVVHAVCVAVLQKVS